uniref:Zinc knuckle CX2CX4HX4C n=1 Tax=Tanacetum cinerariifolium TaxID=118510 RepID=A0A6L2MT34_TANCI|nr:zinc knuckle CX2CX4HX4C [Tanacetum cinerariifolium]
MMVVLGAYFGMAKREEKQGTNKQKTIKLSVLSNDEIVNGADVAISLVELEEVNRDDSTNNVLIPLDSWTSGLLEYKLPLNKTIDIEYEWQPPRCDTCKKFNHKDEQCPKQVKVAAPTKVSDDGFVEVTCKHGNRKQNAKTRHIDGVWLTKPKPNYYYRHISKSANMNGEASTSQPREKKEPYAPRPNNKSKDVLGLHEINIVLLQNSFDALMVKDKKFEEVKNGFVEDNGKPIDGLVDDARKKVEAPPKKSRMETGCVARA